MGTYDPKAPGNPQQPRIPPPMGDPWGNSPNAPGRPPVGPGETIDVNAPYPNMPPGGGGWPDPYYPQGPMPNPGGGGGGGGAPGAPGAPPGNNEQPGNEQPGDGGSGSGGGVPLPGGGGGMAHITFGDPGNLPFIPNFDAPPPGGNYQPTPFTPNYTPWGASNFSGGGTRPGHVVTPDPFSGGPPAVGGGAGGGGGLPSDPRGPGAGMPGGGAPGAGMFNPNDPYNVYLSSVPVMEREAKRQVQDRVAQMAPGNRFSTASTRIAADVGADTALRQNKMFNELMYNHAQQNENRALQSSLAGMGFAGQDFDRMQRGEQIAGNFAGQDLDRMLSAANAGNALGRTQEDIQSGRLRDLLAGGQYETDRMTKLNLLPYEEFLNSRKGYLPEIMQGATSQGAGSQPSPFSTQTSGKPGLLDIGMATAPIWAGPSAPWFMAGK